MPLHYTNITCMETIHKNSEEVYVCVCVCVCVCVIYVIYNIYLICL